MGSTRPPVTFTHKFICMPMARSDQEDHHFLIGSDLLPKVFPEGVPPEYYCRSTDVGNVARSQLEGKVSVCSVRDFLAPNSLEPQSEFEAGKDELSPEKLEDFSSTDLRKLLAVVHETGAGASPVSEKPKRLDFGKKLDWPNAQSRLRCNLLFSRLERSINKNNKITGFCTVPRARLKIEFDTSLLTHPYRGQYRIADSLKPLVTEVIERWLKEGRIKPAKVGCVYNNPLIVVPKKDDEGKLTAIRVCIDPRALNLVMTTGDSFQIPLIKAMLERFGGSLLFGEFDLAEAYLQFPLDEESKQYTAFTWGNQQYVFNGCPFGLSLLPNFFQRVMSWIFRDLTFVTPYLDNLPFGSKTWEEHLSHAIEIVDRLNASNLRIKPSSIKIGYGEMRCLGHMVSGKGISLDPDKLSEVEQIPFPQTSKAMQSFLGVVGYLRDHVRHYAEITAPLEAVKFQKVIEQTNELFASFQLTKDAIAKAPILQFARPDLPFRIATDASNTGVGGVLYQPRLPDEPMTAHNIVEICSKRLKTHQRDNYAAYKKELWGVVYCLRQFHPHIWGRDGLVVETDHRPLTYMFLSSTLSPALTQWFDVLMDYSFTIRHRPGILNVLPDALSRLYINTYDRGTWGVSNKTIPQILLTNRDTSFVEDDPVFKSLVKVDPETAVAVRAHHESVTQPVMIRAADVRPVTASEAAEVETSAVSSDVDPKVFIALRLRGKVAPPEADRETIVQREHALGHFGREAIRKSIYNKGFWWPNMVPDIERALQSCDACTRYNIGKVGFHPFTPIFATGPGDHYQVDLSVHLPESVEGFTVLLHLVDVFTGFTMLRPLKEGTASAVAEVLWDIFTIIGPPRILQSDNGAQFTSEVVAMMNKLIGVQPRFIAPYNPRADGKVERSVGTSTSVIKKLVHGHTRSWPLFVPFAQFAVNCKINETTNSTPFALMFGRRANELKDFSHLADNAPSPLALHDWQLHQEKLLSVIYPAIDDRIKSMAASTRKRLDSYRRLLITPLPADTCVMIKDPTRSTKWEPVWLGPYFVVRKTQGGTYEVRGPDGDVLTRTVPLDQLKVLSKRPAELDDNIYEIDKIMEHAGSDGHYVYLVKWKGYSADESTWEPASNILDYRCVRQYWDAKRASQQTEPSSMRRRHRT